MSTLPQFYFLTEDYFDDFPFPGLMINKPSKGGKPHGRPCFFAFPDTDNPQIYWLVPISSRIEKYEKIAKKHGKRYSNSSTISFGFLLGRETAFLIQNMCPVISKYMVPYMNSSGDPITINNKLANEIKQKALAALKKTKKGQKVVFPDILKIYAVLDEETKPH